MKLTDIKIKSIKPPIDKAKESYVDGDGLRLIVTNKGGKYWEFRYTYNNKPDSLNLGKYPHISLADAREKRNEFKKQLAHGVDIKANIRQEKQSKALSDAITFEVIAREWHEKKREEWTERHSKYVLRRLEADLFPAIGSMPINTITTVDFLNALRVVEKRGAYDITKRMRQTGGQIFRYAVATGRAERDSQL